MRASSRIIGTKSSSSQTFTPFWSWDFTTQGNSGWTTGTYTSSGGGGPSATWQSTYYDIWSGTDGPNLNYSAASVTRNVTISSSAQLVVYLDLQTLNAGGSLGVVRIGQSQSITGTSDYGNLSRRALRRGYSNATVNDTSVSVSSVSQWVSGQSSQGRIYLYGIYMALTSEENSLRTFLSGKGLTLQP